MGGTITDEELIKEYLSGDEKAFEGLLDRHLRGVYSFVFRYVGKDPAISADDITQEVFLKVWKNLAKYSPESASFKTWILGIARNCAIDHLRRRQRVSLDEEVALQITDAEPLPDELFVLAEKRKLLDQVISELPLMYREVIILRYQNELSLPEISQALNRPIETIKSQHRRALLKLKALIGDAPQSDLITYN